MDRQESELAAPGDVKEVIIHGKQGIAILDSSRCDQAVGLPGLNAHALTGIEQPRRVYVRISGKVNQRQDGQAIAHLVELVRRLDAAQDFLENRAYQVNLVSPPHACVQGLDSRSLGIDTFTAENQ